MELSKVGLRVDHEHRCGSGAGVLLDLAHEVVRPVGRGGDFNGKIGRDLQALVGINRGDLAGS